MAPPKPHQTPFLCPATSPAAAIALHHQSKYPVRKRTSSGLVEGVTNTTASLPPSPELPKNNLVPARRTWLHIVTSPMLRGGWWSGLFACPCTSHDIHGSGQRPGLGPPEGSVYNLLHNLTYKFTTIHYFCSRFGYPFFFLPNRNVLVSYAGVVGLSSYCGINSRSRCAARSRSLRPSDKAPS